MDIKEFFPSISQTRVAGVLRSLSIAQDFVDTISIICCFNGELPQGAPSSPIVSNMICFRLDKELLIFAKQNRCIYARYVDRRFVRNLRAALHSVEKLGIVAVQEKLNNTYKVEQRLSQGMSGGSLLDINDEVISIIHKGGDHERQLSIDIKVLLNWLKKFRNSITKKNSSRQVGMV